jgi:hypothetical protein
MSTQQKIDELKTKNLADGGRFSLEDIPLRSFYDQSQYLYNQVLPAIVKREYARNPKLDPTRSADYALYFGIYKSLLYAVMIVDRNQYYVRKLQRANQMNDFLQSRADLAESQLLRYTTMEDLWLSDARDKAAAGVAQRVEDFLNKK